ncbi:MAG: aminotransferase class I/II-fold pyridoxal phosphate-dependent enzyme [Ruminiclostridium sp.]|nr:aminotransferase class I/II-fold pyridoxal phosphate-dependent enzyme [Ruminiclostridium sp.]
MIRFECDYAEGAHERVLQRLVETNLEQTPGYSEDHYCATARWYIRELCEDETVDVHFLVGGTQTNALVIAAALRPHQGVIAASTGHINVHETGAIESYGHKVLAVPCGRDGKISAQDVRNVYDAHWNDVTHEHMVQPGMVYISQPTENGTLYSKAELEAMWATCRDCGLFLFIDGARLGYGLMSEACDLTVPDLARLCDAFYLGGTKQGLLFGEALVLTHPALKKDFRYLIKQHGGMLAKGRLLGVQFCTMFEDGLYFRAAKEAVDHAMTIRRAFEDRGYPMIFDSYTNQQFPVLPDGVLAELEKEFAFSFWEKVDEGHTAVRVCTSWATQAASVQALIAALDQVKEG